MAKVLFVHQNFPGQFPNIVDTLVERGDQVAAIGGREAHDRPGVALHRWRHGRGTTPDIFGPATRAEADLIRADAVALVALRLKQGGFEPDLIVGHPGWGETIHLREVYPRAKTVLLGEMYYQPQGGDEGFDPEFGLLDLAARARVNAKNATGALAYTLADRIVCPTRFQALTFPTVFHPRISVVHEGLNLDRAQRKPDARLQTPSGKTLTRSDRVVTFVSRRLERIRGFHIFMRALPEIMAADPRAEVIVLGSDTDAGYTARLPDGQTWKGKMLAEVGDRLDRSRLHFLGHVPHDRMIDALSISSAHVYYTYPFVLSWSLIEAMACECLIIGSDTAPVRDAIADGRTGVLNDFFDVGALSQAVIAALEEPARLAPMRAAVRQVALQKFDRRVGVPAWMKLIDSLAA